MTQEHITVMEGKRIILAVTGSIAGYKAVDLASKLTQAGALVDVIMTAAAQRFVTPLTFQAVTGRAVYTDMWQTGGDGLPTHIAHVGLGEGADLLLVAPATANTLAKLAHGQADDLLSVTVLAARCPLIVAPAMDGGMYEHPATQANLQILQGRGALLIEPDEGRFASGLVGRGRLPETATLIGHMRRVLGADGPLAGRKVVITAGGTREAFDPVRHITNRASGKQGHALAQAALDMGAYVVLVSSAQGLEIPIGATYLPVDSAAEMLEAVLSSLEGADTLVMAAAVADFRPDTRAQQKIKKSDSSNGMALTLARTADILLEVKARREHSGAPRIAVGFAAESENLLLNAQEKLAKKGLELMVANDISSPDAGFAVDTNRVVLLDAHGGHEHVELMSKAKISERILRRVALLLEEGF